MPRTITASASFTTSRPPSAATSYPSTGMPPDHLPFRRVAAILSRVRSEMISRSNWAKESRMLRVSRPMELVVLNCWVTDTNEAPCRSSVSMMRAKSRRDRLNRSTLYTTMQSMRPARTSARSRLSAGRSMLPPVYPPSSYRSGMHVQPSPRWLAI